MKRILFRADAHKTIGSGDLVSLIHLSRYFESSKWQKIFMVRNFNEARSLLKLYGLKNIVIIDKNISVAKEVALINKTIKDFRVNVVLFEITERKLIEFRGITNDVIKASVSFDKDIPSDLDLVVNWEPQSKKMYALHEFPKTKFLLGPEYVILPKEFNLAQIKKRHINKKAKRILVTMGGADELNFTKKIAQIIIKNKLRQKFIFIVGATYKYVNDLKNELNSSGINYEIQQGLKSIFKQFISSDMAISAGGLTLFELIAARIPVVAVATYKHQINRCCYFHKMGLIKYLGFRSYKENQLIDYLNNGFKRRGVINLKPEAIKESLDELMQ